MEFTVQDISETRKSVSATVPAKAVGETEKATLKRFSQKVKVPGFRPGKAPESIIKSKYRNEFGDELKQALAQKAFEHVSKEGDFEVYSLIKVDVGTEEPDAGKDHVILFTLDVTPGFKLPEYKGIPVKLPKVEVKEEDVEKALNHVREQRAEYVVTEGVAEKGDYVKLAYEGSVDGKLISEILPEKPIFGTQKATWEEAGAEDAPGVQSVIAGIIGMKAGDEATFTETFAEDHEQGELAGKTAEYKVTVHEVRNKVLPEIDADFLEKMNVESMDALKENIKNEFKQQKENQSLSEAQKQILDYLNEQTEVAVPESAIEGETDSLLRNYMTRMMYQGVSAEQFEAEKESLIEKAREAAGSTAKSNLILSKIAKEENIEIENKDINVQIFQQAMISRMKPEEFVNEIKKDRSRIEEIKQAALNAKVLDFLNKESKVETIEGAAADS